MTYIGRADRKFINDCNEGDVLASDIVAVDGTIFPKDTELNDYIIKRISGFGIKSIDIYIKHQEDSEIVGLDYSCNNYTYEAKNLFQELAAGRHLNYDKVTLITKEIKNKKNMGKDVIKCLMRISKADKYTYNHSIRTAFYSMMIAKWMNLSNEDIYIAIQSGLLHDVGKTKIPNDILNKKGKLTYEEYDIMKNHSAYGYEIVKDMKKSDRKIKEAVLQHHERMDKSGYPYNLGRDETSIMSRIVAVADVYDAMTSDRIYKSRVTPFEVVEMFNTVGLKKFDSLILDVFFKNLSAYLIGSNVILNNGDMGKIVYIPLHDISKPILKVRTGYMDLYKQSSIKIRCFV